MGQYVLKDTKNGQFHFTLHAENGEVILSSETYTTKGAAFGGIASCKLHSPEESNYVRFVGHDQKHYFNLKAKNSEPIGQSEAYNSSAARDGGIDSCKRNGPNSPVKDATVSAVGARW